MVQSSRHPARFIDFGEGLMQVIQYVAPDAVVPMILEDGIGWLS